MKTLRFLLPLLILIALQSCKEQTSEQEHTVESQVIEEKSEIERIEPPNWWVGFKNQNLQLLVYHVNIKNATVSLSYPGVNLKAIHKADSPNYLFLDLEISETAQAGQFNIQFKQDDGTELLQTYELKVRKKAAEDFVGFDSSDAIYLITPDRFANANPNNDSIEGMNEMGVNRNNDYARHGGDIEGITQHLDYLNDLGVTAIWPSPLLTNDMKNASYHGYAMTDFYEVDPRFGTLEEYKKLSSQMYKRKMKLIMDQVTNHCGLEHWWMTDLPFKDWVNYQEDYVQHQSDWDQSKTTTSSHVRTVNQDTYASEHDKALLTKGWFVSDMPDLNQKNPFMAKYLIQNSIWWVETLELGGIRQDTYPYPDKSFMSDWAGAIMTEYPNFNIVGEEWSTNPLLIAYWQDGHKNHDGYDSNLPSTMDFAMQEKLVSGLKNEETWATGLTEIYLALANDFAYENPSSIMVFPDNHDMSRIFTQLDGDITKTKMAMSYLAVLPRIFQMYYGSEILMNDFEKPGDHGLIRTDFPGGWVNDDINAFTGEGLTDAQADMQAYLKILLNYRKLSSAIHKGKTIHFAPENKIYVLFRILDEEVVVHILNKNDEPVELDLSKFKELNLEGKRFRNIIEGYSVNWKDSLTLDKKGSYIFSTRL